jgi:thymidylate synthase
MDELNVPTRAISLMWNQRSVDVPLGLPFNIASYGLLLLILAEVCNMVPDELIGNLGDCHIYRDQEGGVSEQITRKGHDLPHVHINTEYWPTEGGECGIGPLISNVDALLNNLQVEDFTLEGYTSEPTIKYPLSN